MEKKKETIVVCSSIGGILLTGISAATIWWYKKKKKKNLEDVLRDPEKKSRLVEEIQRCKKTLNESHRFSNAYHEASLKMIQLYEDFFKE